MTVMKQTLIERAIVLEHTCLFSFVLTLHKI